MTNWGLLYIAAASLPLVGGLLIAVCGRRVRGASWIAIVTLAVSVGLSITGLILYTQQINASKAQLRPLQPWTGSVPWVWLSQLGHEGHGKLGYSPDASGVELRLGYHVDALTTVLFTVISTIVFLIVAAVRKTQDARYFVLALLLCGSLLHLILADNLLQLFFWWVLLGLVTAGLAGRSLKLFVLHRVGDVALFVAIVVLAVHTGTLSLVTVREKERDVAGQVVYEDDKPKLRIAQLSVFEALRVPGKDSHDEPFSDPGAEAGQLCRVTPTRTARGKKKLELAERGPLVVVWNQETLNSHYDRPDRRRFDAFDADAGGGHGKGLRTMPYWVLGLAGFAVVLACASKSAQFPFHAWLAAPPTGPSAALATVSLLSGVYLATQFFSLFVPEVILTLAYLGAFTAVLASLLVFKQREPKRLVAFLAVSHFGLAFACLGVDGSGVSLLYSCLLTTVAAVCFLGSGFDLRTKHAANLIGLLILLFAGVTLLMPTVSGYASSKGGFSSNSIWASLWSFVSLHPSHILLILLPLVSVFFVVAVGFKWLFKAQQIDLPEMPIARPGTGMKLPMIGLIGLAAVCLNLHRFGFSESSPLGLQEVNNQVESGYFKTGSWLRGLHEITLIGPRGLALTSLVIVFILAAVFAFLRRSVEETTEASQDAPPQPLTDEINDATLVKPFHAAGAALDTLDRRLWPGLAATVGNLALTTAALARGFEDRILGGIVRGIGWVGRQLTRPFRRVSS